MTVEPMEQFLSKAEVGIEAFDHVERRVLGTLLEKAFTTPASYPLTLNALVTGCNQKSNRDPVSDYDEGDVLAGLEDLENKELAAVVHSSGSFTDRFRHFARKKFPFSEMQLAMITELLLRGRQSLGDLRARASRMEKIESLDVLREELGQLLASGYVRASGDLNRRGVEVDHNFYLPGEVSELTTETPPKPVAAPVPQAQPAPAVASGAVDELRAEIAELKQQVSDLEDEVSRLKRDLGV